LIRNISAKDVNYKCLSCGGIGIISYKLPLCNNCINFWEILNSSFNKKDNAFEKLVQIFSFLQNEDNSRIISSLHEVAKSPRDSIELGIGTRSKLTQKKPLYHYIVLKPFKIDEHYKRVFGDYLCSNEESNRRIEFEVTNIKICSACTKRLEKLKKRFSHVFIKNEIEAYEEYYYHFLPIIEKLYKYYKTKI